MAAAFPSGQVLDTHVELFVSEGQVGEKTSKCCVFLYISFPPLSPMFDKLAASQDRCAKAKRALSAGPRRII